VSEAPAQATAGAGRRLSLITVDQALSSLSNLAITVLAAHALAVGTFGVFAIVFLTYVTAQGLVRALLGEPLLVHPDEVRDRTTEVVGTGLMAGAAATVVCAGLALVLWLLDVRAAPAFGVLALCLPLLFVQDLGRYLAFALHRPARALVLDGAWLGLVVLASAYLLVTDERSLTAFVAVWAGSGAVAGAIVLAQYPVRTVRRSTAWLRQTWTFSWRYALSYASMQGAALGVSVALIWVADAEALAAVRGAWLLLGLYVQLQAAAIAAGVAEVSRIRSWGPGLDRHVRRTTGLTASAALANAVVLLVLPDALGRVALGDTWAVTEPLLVPAGVVMVMMGLISGVRSALLGLRLVRVTVVVDLGTTLLTFAATIVGAVLDEARGAFVGLAVAQSVVALIWWAAFLRRRALATTGHGPLPHETIPAC
jgi:O-antigen/teichoic acid export membrane protein